jgi:hypothetical protein
MDRIQAFLSGASVSTLGTNIIRPLKSVDIFNRRIRNSVTQTLALAHKCVLKAKPVTDFVDSREPKFAPSSVGAGHCFVSDDDPISDKVGELFDPRRWKV